MKTKVWWPLLTACGTAVALGGAWAQTTDAGYCPKTREEVRSECVAFLKTHVWNEQAGDYVQKATGQPMTGTLPEGVATREQVRAERDKFLSANRWDETKGMWEPIQGAPRNLATMSRAEMQKETAAFMRTHDWDEIGGMYVDKPTK